MVVGTSISEVISLIKCSIVAVVKVFKDGKCVWTCELWQPPTRQNRTESGKTAWEHENSSSNNCRSQSEILLNDLWTHSMGYESEYSFCLQLTRKNSDRNTRNGQSIIDKKSYCPMNDVYGWVMQMTEREFG